MLAKLKEKTNTTTYYLPNWIDATESDPSQVAQHPYFSQDKFSILYAGNVGDKQDWSLFKKIVAALDFTKFEVIVVGAGAKMELLKEQLKASDVQFYDPVPLEGLASLLASADVHILFQKAEVVDTVMPSKILGMMASARPSIITGHPDAEPAKIIEVSQGGYYKSTTDAQEIVAILNSLRTNSDRATLMGSNARKFIVEKYARKAILKDFTDTLRRL
jgi:colanic acid biosynthesis glycosyl transferase WcaI